MLGKYERQEERAVNGHIRHRLLARYPRCIRAVSLRVLLDPERVLLRGVLYNREEAVWTRPHHFIPRRRGRPVPPCPFNDFIIGRPLLSVQLVYIGREDDDIVLQSGPIFNLVEINNHTEGHLARRLRRQMPPLYIKRGVVLGISVCPAGLDLACPSRR